MHKYSFISIGEQEEFYVYDVYDLASEKVNLHYVASVVDGKIVKHTDKKNLELDSSMVLFDQRFASTFMAEDINQAKHLLVNLIGGMKLRV